jgi:hypothetical protein
MKSKFNFFLGVLLLILISASASMAKFDHSWGGYHWARQSNPFTLRMGNNVNADWFQYMDVARIDWNKSTVLDTVIVPGSVSPKRCTLTSGMIQVCNERYGRTGWLGIAGVSVNQGHILGAYVKLNDSYSMTVAEKQLVTCQEIGHTFGLAHQDENFNNAPLGTCMDYTSTATAGSNMHPNQHDYDMLQTIYSHLDTTTTIGAAAIPAEVAMEDYRSPRAWGQVVRVSQEGNAIVFRRDFPNGHQLFTFVFPVPGGRLADEEHDDH